MTISPLQANDLCKRGCETVLPGTAQVQRPVPPRPQDPPALTETSSLRDVPNRPAGIYQIKEYQIPTRNSSGRADISGALFKLEVNSTTNLFLYQVHQGGHKKRDTEIHATPLQVN